MQLMKLLWKSREDDTRNTSISFGNKLVVSTEIKRMISLISAFYLHLYFKIRFTWNTKQE